MRLTMILVGALVAVGCGNNNNPDGGAGVDMSMAVDMSGSSSGGDMAGGTKPDNTPGMIFCYGATCMTSSAAPVCCSSKGAPGSDGGFLDTCVATSADCVGGTQDTPYECGQAADCKSGICCGSIGMTTKGTPFFNSTKCEASCASGETQLCVTATECKTSGAMCAGQKISGRNIGLCK
jgi:hypothetical protein